MALDFPANPSIGSVYTGTNSIIYIFDGIKWQGQIQPQTELNTGLIRYYDNNIEGLTSQDINITTIGTGTVTVPSLTLPVGSLLEETATIETIIADLILDTVVDYSTGTGDTLTIGTIGNPKGINHPWTVYRFTTVPTPALEVNDIIAGPGVPVGSTISYVGTGTYDSYIVTDKVFPLGVPVGGTIITTVRPVVNATISIKTNVDTDISLEPGGGTGVIISHSDIVPFTNNNQSLGTPTKRFKQLWLGGGTIFIADDVLGIDLTVAAINGDLVVQGGAGLEVGQFVLRDNELRITDPNTEIFIGQIGAPAPVTFRRTIQVRDSTDEFNLLNVDQQGRIIVLSTIATDPTQAAMSIVGARKHDYKSPNNLGVLLQLTGSSTAPSRIYHDSYGAANYSAFIGRHARGNSTTSTQTLSGDIISRIGANPHDDVGFANISTMRIDFVNDQDQTTTARGSKIEFWTTPNNSTVIGKRVTINGSDIILTAGGLGGITYQDNTRQTTAWTGTVVTNQITNLSQGAVTKIVAGNGITVSTSTGIVGIDSTGVQNTVGTINQIVVTDAGSKNLTLSLPQNINSTASVTFQNITVTGNINVLGTSTIVNTISLDSKILYLANSATTLAHIDGGGIQLGSGTNARSIFYNLSEDRWNTDGGGILTLAVEATTATFNNLTILENAYFGASYLGYDFANAEIQADANVNSYTQIVIKNHNSGTNASSDLIAANDIGTDENYYIDVGINSSGYSNPTYSISGPNEGYLYVAGSSLSVGTVGTDTTIKFFTSDATTESLRATITDSGMNVVGGFTAATINGYTLPNTSTTAGWVLSTDGTGITSWVMPQSGYVGSRGNQGIIGFTGSAGYSGSVGFVGSRGIIGFTGSQGIQGVIGFVGSQGINGINGFTGSVGYVGSQGVQGITGFTGSQGVAGSLGYTGSVGYTGSQGVQGVTGFTGSQGIQGTQGITGFIGSQGIQGITGFIGSFGFTGSQGYVGSIGYIGSVGYTGSASSVSGPIGYIGSMGYTGSSGGVTSLSAGNNIILTTSTGAVSITRIDGSQNVITGDSTATYIILTTDQYFGSTRSLTGGCTVTLPVGSSVPVGRQYIIKDEGGQSGTFGRRITLTAAGSDTIDGSATRTITSNYGALTVLWTGTRWSVI